MILFDIEIETYLNKISKYFKVDDIKEKLNLITMFFERLSHPKTNDEKIMSPHDILSSERYNGFLTGLERDIRIIRNSQVDTKNKLISSWNTMEQVKDSVGATINEIYDINFRTELPQASQFVNITLAVAKKQSSLAYINGDPIIQDYVSDPNVHAYHGKSYGAWIPNEVTNEDGLRPNTKDANKIVDNRDTFYEIEVVTLQEEHNDVIYEQSINENPVTLTVVVKIVFNRPRNINYVYIKPHNFASGTYYELTDIVLSNGVIQSPVEFDNVVMNEAKTITFETPFEDTRSLYLTFKQEKGYYMKYSAAYFDLMGKEYMVDVTGPVLMDDSSNYDAPISYIKYKMQNIEEWILGIWKPDVSYDVLPKLMTSKGDNGFELIDSRESKRRRWAIGIEDIDFGENIYEDKSEIVTMPIDIPDGTKIVQLRANDNESGTIYYYLSFNNGLDWNRINPIGTRDEMVNFKMTPDRIYLNSDLSIERKKLKDSGLAGFVDTESKQVRAKAVLIMGDQSMPKIKNFYPVFLSHE